MEKYYSAEFQMEATKRVNKTGVPVARSSQNKVSMKTST